MKKILLLFLIGFLFLTVITFVRAQPTGSGGWSFPLGSSSGNDLNAGSGKLTVQGATGNVGIGSASPQNKLTVSGTLAATTFSGSGASLTGLTGGGWTDGGTNVYVTTATDNLGVGTTQPTSLLNISSTTNQDLFRLDDNGPGDTTPFVIDAGGNVGIGTTQPNNKLQVSGLMYFSVSGTPGNTFVGKGAGASITTGQYNTFVGDSAGYNTQDGSANSFAGYKAGYSNTSGSNNSAMGAEAGSSNQTGSGNVFLGYQSGYYETGSNKLYIGIGSTNPPLIYGDFSAVKIGIGTASPPSTLSVGTTSQFQVDSSGNALTAGGAVSAPSVSFTADTDTGRWSSGADTLDFSTGGSQRWRIDSTGNTGLGTTSIAGRLIAQGTGTSSGITFQTQNSSAGALVQMFDSGNVGINSASPRGKLSVVGGDVLTGTGTFNNTSVNEDFYVTGNMEADGIIYGDGSNLDVPGGGWSRSSTNMFVTTLTDNVGIGTHQPNSLLNVSSTANQEMFRVDDNGNGDLSSFIVNASGQVGIGTTAACMNGALTVGGLINVPTSSTMMTFGRNAALGTIWSASLYVGDSAGFTLGSSDVTAVGYQAFYSGSTSANTGTAVGYLAGRANTTSQTIFLGSEAGSTATPPSGQKLYIGNSPTNTLLYGDQDAQTFGIGTASPASKLSVGAASSFQVNATGITRGPIGAASAPAFSFSSDPDTGAWSGVANSLDFSTAGSAREKIDSSGNLGIGTSTLGGRLIVMGAGTSTGITFQTLNSSGSALVTMKDSGNVGINSVNPRGSLDIVGGDTFFGNGAFTNTSGSEDLYVTGNLEVDGVLYGDAGGLSNLSSTGGWSDGGTNVYTTAATDNVGIGTSKPPAFLTISSTANQNLFRVDDNGNGDTSPFIIKPNGYVGIGTVSPRGILEVNLAAFGIHTVTFADNLSSLAIGNASGGFTALTTGQYNTSIGSQAGNGNRTGSYNTALGVSAGYSAGAGFLNGNNNTCIGYQSGISMGTSSTGNLFFGYNAANGDSGSNKLYVTTLIGATSKNLIYGDFSSTRVGIATTAPPSTLSIGTTSPFQVDSSGNMLLPSGAVGTPSVSFTSDTDTGVWSIGANTLNLSVGGTERVRLDSSGNLGIGTQDPAARLIVQGAGTTTGIGFQSQNSSGTALVTMVDSGNVGIGSVHPRGKLGVVGGDVLLGNGSFNNTSGNEDLYVTGNLEVDGVLFGDGAGLTNASASSNGWTDGGTNVYMTTTTDNIGVGTTQPGGKLIVKGNGTTTGITFQTKDSSGSSLVNFFDSGNVGINSSNPDAKLRVFGGDVFLGNGTFNNASGNEDLYSTGNTEVDGIIYGDGTNLTSVPGGTVNGFTDGGTNVYMTTTTDNAGIGTTQPLAKLDVNGVGASGLGAATAPGMAFRTDLDGGMWSTSANILNLSTGGSERVRIDSNGNVGIGTTVLQQRFVVLAPATQTIAAGNTVTADACGTFKRLTSTADRTTSTTNTFTAPSTGLTGCCMNVVNVGSNIITLDNNTNFKSAGAANVAVGPNDTVRVCCDGSFWYQIGGTGNN